MWQSLSCTVLYCTVLYCTVLYCTVLYKVWQSLSCHTLTLDYRGYGDSVMAAQLGESTVVEDAKTAIKLVRDTVGDKPKVGSSVDISG